MTDEEYMPARLIVKEYRRDPPSRMVWFKVDGFRSMDIGIKEGDPLYILRQQDLNRLWDEINTLSHENAALRHEIDEYKEYFGLQKKFQEGTE